LSTDDENSSTILFDIVDMLVRDRRANALRPLNEYLARFPGHEVALAREYLACLEPPLATTPAAPRDAATAAPVPGLHHYHVIRELGRGGQAVVLLALDVRLGRQVALKVLTTPFGEVATARRNRLKREAAVIARLDHPGICNVYDAVLEGDVPFLAMRYVEGETLRERIAAARARFLSLDEDQHVVERKPPASRTEHESTPPVCYPGTGNALRETLAFFERAARALHTAHEAGVVHRDIKPANLMIALDGSPVILDFGLARDERTDSDELTLTGETFGTPGYMSPEQLDSRGERPDRRTDVYSLAVALYECLTLSRPFGESRTDALVNSMRTETPRDPRAMNPTLPEEIAVVLGKALEREPSRRYATALDLAEDLRRIRQFEPIRARPASAMLRFKRWTQRHRQLAVFLIGAFLLLIGGLILALVDLQRVRRAERLSKKHTEEMLVQSARQELQDLAARAEALWPASPDRLADYDRWIEKANALVGGRPADPSQELAAQPSMQDYSSQLAAIRSHAKERTPAQMDADRRKSANFDDWELARAKLLWMKRMLGAEPWPSEIEADAALPKDLSSDVSRLNKEAWRIVVNEPLEIVFGSEMQALVMSKRAVAAANSRQRAGFQDTLAWTLYYCGRLDEALAVKDLALASAPEPDDELTASCEHLQSQIELWNSAAARAARTREADDLAMQVSALGKDVEVRRTYEFDDAQERWWHTQLAALVGELEVFTDPKTGVFSAGTSERHGWGMLRRRDEAASLEERSVTGTRAAQRWREATSAIAGSEKYKHLKLAPQLGLLPIGEDPQSRLWEFAHVESGDVPERGPDGRLVLTESTGIVLVLIPEGPFEMGAQNEDRLHINFDPQALSIESPLWTVRLDAHFISKYEMTQGQWRRFVGRNPSRFGPNQYRENWNRANLGWSALHPVEQVSWFDCSRVLGRVGLMLPTEAQGEQAARGGTTTPWWTGAESSSLSNAANLADAYARGHGGEGWSEYELELDDGATVHTRIGSYRANGFGLFDVVGNVCEWCRDGFGDYSIPKRTGDAESRVQKPSTRVYRGGSFNTSAPAARSAFRTHETPETIAARIGVRPARALDTP
jgi:serine/threonine protein kinase/formylglycine-generating enzyme required for sulfatase activity